MSNNVGARLHPPDWVQKAIELDAKGWTLTPIAKHLGVHRSNVYSQLVKARGKGKQKNRLKKAAQIPE